MKSSAHALRCPPPPSASTKAPRRDAAFNRWLAVLILGSFLVLIVSAVLEVGIAATPYETTDSLGRPMGFNDPLHGEHFLILWRNFHFAALLRPAHAYTWLLAAMQVAGAWLLLTSAHGSGRFTRWFFATQMFVFPFGLVFCWVAPLILASLCVGDLGDREGLTDFSVGATWFLGQTTWVCVSLILLFALRGPGLGLSRFWRAARAATGAGARTFANALR